MATARNRPSLKELAEPYSAGWYKKMVEIWGDRLSLMGIVRTGALLRSVQEGEFNVTDDSIRMTFRFLLYGIYVDRGVGKGFNKGNGGYLAFMDKSYRRVKGMRGKPREKRPWFSVSWGISTRVMKDKLGDLLGEAFSGMLDNLED